MLTLPSTSVLTHYLYTGMLAIFKNNFDFNVLLGVHLRAQVLYTSLISS